MTRQHRPWTVLAAVAIAASAGACGGGGGDGGSPASDSAGSATSAAPGASGAAPSGASADAGPGACGYVTTAQASGLAASPVMPGVTKSVPFGPFTMELCEYNFEATSSAGVRVGVTDFGTDSASFFDEVRQADQEEGEYQEVAGVGDEAYYVAGNLEVRKGDKVLTLFVGRNDPTGPPRLAAALPDEKQLAALVLPQL